MKIFYILVGIFSLPIYALTTAFTPAEVNLMHQIYQQNTANITLNQVEQRLIENQFLLSQAKIHQPDLLKRQSQVGFDTPYHVRRYLLTLFTTLNKNKPFKTDSFTLENITISADELTQLLGDYPATGILSDSKLKVIKNSQLLKSQKLTSNLLDIYTSVSMQTRFKLHQGNLTTLLTELNNLYHFKQVQRAIQAVLIKNKINDTHLYEIALATLLRTPMQSYYGVTDLMHADSPMIAKYVTQITALQIKQYYGENQNEFKYLSQLNSQAALFNSRTEAMAFFNHANNKSWQSAIKILKTPDIFSIYGNILNRKINARNWPVQTAFNMPEQRLSKPIRSPKGQWLVVNNHKKTYDIYPLKTQTVQYMAKQTLAKKKAVTMYQQQFILWQKKTGVKS